MKTTIKIMNVKNDSCSNTIHKSLASITGVFGVKVDREAREITVEHTDEVSREKLVEKLLSIGYPENTRG